MNSSGIPTTLSTRSRAPPSDRFRTMQEIVDLLPLKVTFAPFSVRRLSALRRVSSVKSPRCRLGVFAGNYRARLRLSVKRATSISTAKKVRSAATVRAPLPIRIDWFSISPPQRRSATDK